MARYRLTQAAYIARSPGGAHEPLPEGAEIEYDGVPGPHMDPLDADARAAVAARGEIKTTIPDDIAIRETEPEPAPRSRRARE